MKRAEKAAAALRPRAQPDPILQKVYWPGTEAIGRSMLQLRARIAFLESEFPDQPASMKFRDALKTAVWALNEQLTSGGGKT